MVGLSLAAPLVLVAAISATTTLQIRVTQAKLKLLAVVTENEAEDADSIDGLDDYLETMGHTRQLEALRRLKSRAPILPQHALKELADLVKALSLTDDIGPITFEFGDGEDSPDSLGVELGMELAMRLQEVEE